MIKLNTYVTLTDYRERATFIDLVQAFEVPYEIVNDTISLATHHALDIIEVFTDIKGV